MTAMIPIFIGSVLISLAIGVIVGRKIFNEEPKGTLRIINYDDEGPYLFLELHSDVDVDTLKRGEHVIFDVRVEDARK